MDVDTHLHSNDDFHGYSYQHTHFDPHLYQYGEFHLFLDVDADVHLYGGVQRDEDSDVHSNGCAAYCYGDRHPYVYIDIDGDGDGFFHEYDGA